MVNFRWETEAGGRVTSEYYEYDTSLQIFCDDPNDEVVRLTSIKISDGTKTTETFDASLEVTLSKDYMYFVLIVNSSGETLAGPDERLKSIDYVEPHTKVYGICDSKCRVEVPAKKDFVRKTFNLSIKSSTGGKVIKNIPLGDFDVHDKFILAHDFVRSSDKAVFFNSVVCNDDTLVDVKIMIADANTVRVIICPIDSSSTVVIDGFVTLLLYDPS